MIITMYIQDPNHQKKKPGKMVFYSESFGEDEATTPTAVIEDNNQGTQEKLRNIQASIEINVEEPVIKCLEILKKMTPPPTTEYLEFFSRNMTPEVDKVYDSNTKRPNFEDQRKAVELYLKYRAEQQQRQARSALAQEIKAPIPAIENKNYDVNENSISKKTNEKIDEIASLIESMNPLPKVSELLLAINGTKNLVENVDYETQKQAIIKFINKAMDNYIEQQKKEGQNMKEHYKVMDIKGIKKSNRKYIPDTNVITLGVTDYTGNVIGYLQKDFELFQRNDGKIIIVLTDPEALDEIPMKIPIQDNRELLAKGLIQVENLSRMSTGTVEIVNN